MRAIRRDNMPGMGKILIAAIVCLSAVTRAEERTSRSDDGQLIFRSFDSAPFPHASRRDGYQSKSTTFPAELHYSDSTIGIFIPAGFKPSETTDFVVHFHGHMNDVENVFQQFNLADGLRRSGANAILLVPQGPRNAPDSGGGKMEDGGGFERMIRDVVSYLVAAGKIRGDGIGRITLSAHSGGYRAVSFILRVGGLREQIADVLLFDATYGQLEGFADYCKLGGDRRLVSIFTDHLAAENYELITLLQKRGVTFTAIMESDLKPESLAQREPIFIHTLDLPHNDVVSKRDYFSMFLATRRALK